MKENKRTQAGTLSAEQRKAMFVECYITNGGSASMAAKQAGYSLGAYEYFKARAQKSLDRLRPFAEWRAWLGDRWSAIDFKCFGSPEEFYARMHAELTKEALDPSPNVLTIGPDGKGVFGWEF